MRLVWLWGTCALLFAACTPSISLDLGVSLDDECLLSFPECGTTDGALTYYCVNSDGERVDGCRVVCVGAREMSCAADGPMCLQSAGTGDVMVPVLCVKDM